MKHLITTVGLVASLAAPAFADEAFTLSSPDIAEGQQLDSNRAIGTACLRLGR
jgi:hypothetical protein